MTIAEWVRLALLDFVLLRLSFSRLGSCLFTQMEAADGQHLYRRAVV